MPVSGSDGPAPLHHAGDSLLLVLPLPIHLVAGNFYLERQACNGLRLWLENFDRIVFCAPLSRLDAPPADSLLLAEAVPVGPDRLRIEPLPTAWTPLAFLRAFSATRRRLAALIEESRYLHFGIGGLWGDWGGVGALIAHRQGRKAAVWTDRVESAVMRFQAGEYRGLRRLYRRLNAWLAGHWERHVIRRSALGLFHGMDTYPLLCTKGCLSGRRE